MVWNYKAEVRVVCSSVVRLIHHQPLILYFYLSVRALECRHSVSFGGKDALLFFVDDWTWWVVVVGLVYRSTRWWCEGCFSSAASLGSHIKKRITTTICTVRARTRVRVFALHLASHFVVQRHWISHLLRWGKIAVVFCSDTQLRLELEVFNHVLVFPIN